ncbi:urea ABC transporter substrate-binding protein [Bradyrhizobium uaiense]|uniref:Transporter substrate-binding protein n=1 Tax=Bradyrhizobium uaiense TaxID=2594946 RepID=A0A6P1BL83_9BRAD|nr:ABC transporter substrate-binding protein [Bradyrhizobium uaiense]NEU99195.1 transporter substrate-binding protein [Bradyrhizobium uaiense]
MSMKRRDFLKTALASSAAIALSPGLVGNAQAATDILVGSIHDLSGGLDAYGKPMQDAMVFAAEEINAAGGLLGRQIKIVTKDPQSSMQQYAQLAQELALRDKVAVLHGGITSASREVIRPIMRKTNTLYFYNTQYEGGVCDRNTFCTGQTPAQNLATAVPDIMRRWGKKIYIVAADYNYGQIVSQWVKKYALENGGNVLSIDYFPLDVTEFGPTVQKIQAASPDFVFSALVGGAHVSFYRQWAAAGLKGKIPMASSTFSHGQEHIVLNAPESDGILVSGNYFPSIDNPANKAFTAAWAKRFGADYPYITELAAATYQGMHLWAKSVSKAGTLDRAKVLEALESGMSFDGPTGRVSIDPATHHCTMDIRLGEVKEKKWSIRETWPQRAPLDTSSVCDLIKNPGENQQFVIKI